MKRAFVVGLVALLALLALGVSPAVAAKPTLVESIVFDPSVSEEDPFLTRACGTRITVAASGHFTVKEYYDQDGGLVRVVAHPSLRQTISSSVGSFFTPDVGVDKTTFNEDGTITVFGTGIHLRVKGDASAIGLWRLVIDGRTGELVSAEYHGNFDVLAPDLLDYICSRLT